MEDTKRCTKCRQFRILPEFGRAPRNRDGRHSWCSTCMAAKTRRHYQQNLRACRESNRQRYDQNKDDYARRFREWAEAHPGGNRARQIVHRALRSGLLVKPDRCERCGEARELVAHHDDYSQALEVRWWCRSCHRRNHGRHKAPPAAIEMMETVA